MLIFISNILSFSLVIGNRTEQEPDFLSKAYFLIDNFYTGESILFLESSESSSKNLPETSPRFQQGDSCERDQDCPGDLRCLNTACVSYLPETSPGCKTDNECPKNQACFQFKCTSNKKKPSTKHSFIQNSPYSKLVNSLSTSPDFIQTTHFLYELLIEWANSEENRNNCSSSERFAIQCMEKHMNSFKLFKAYLKKYKDLLVSQRRLLESFGDKYFSGETIEHTGSSSNFEFDIVALDSDSFVFMYVDSPSAGDEHLNMVIYDGQDNQVYETVVNQSSGLIKSVASSKLSNGNFIIAWVIQYSFETYINYRIFDTSGMPTGSEKQVANYNGMIEVFLDVSGLTDGKFVIVWDENVTESNSSFGVYASLFYQDETVFSSSFHVNSYVINDQFFPCVIGLESGKFVIFWESNLQDGDKFGIYAQLFDTDAGMIGIEFQVSTGAYDQQWVHADKLTGGGFVVVYNKKFLDDGQSRIQCVIYDSSFSIIKDFEVDTSSESFIQEGRPSVSSLEDGFILTWAKDTQALTDNQIKFKIFDQTGTVLIETVEIYSEGGGIPKITNFDDGGFALGWNDQGNYAKAKSFRVCSIENCEECIDSPYTCQECASSYYLHDDGNCEACSDECVECSGSLSSQCTLCLDSVLPYSPPSYCVCPSGFYMSSSDPVTCTACSLTCEECSDFNTCTKCRSDFELVDGSCECGEGEFKDESSSTVECESCDSSCKNCSSSSVCTECFGNLIDVNGKCQCQSGFFTADYRLCNTCDEHCTECECLDCSGSYDEEENELECAMCEEGYYILEKKCEKCSEFCKACEDKYSCRECIGNFELIEGSCQCGDNKVLEDQNCVDPVLDYQVTIETEYFLLAFSENLSTDLSSENIVRSVFKPEEIDFALSITPVSPSEYELRIISPSIPINATGISVEIKKVQGVSGAGIPTEKRVLEINQSRSELRLKLVDEEAEEEDEKQKETDSEEEEIDSDSEEGTNSESEEEETSSDEDEVIVFVSAETAGSSTMIAGGSASIGVSLISGNPSMIWSYLNIMALVYYMPLQDLTLPLTIQKFNQKFDTDFFGTIFDSKDDSLIGDNDKKSPENWYNYGIKYRNLADNLKNPIFFLIIGLIALLILAVWYFCIRKFKKTVKKWMMEFKWGFFLRLWILFYINMIVAGVLSTGTVMLT